MVSISQIRPSGETARLPSRLSPASSDHWGARQEGRAHRLVVARNREQSLMRHRALGEEALYTALVMIS